MSDPTKDDPTTGDGLEAVEAGPRASDAGEGGVGRNGREGVSHPTVTALRDRFGDAVQEHLVSAGDQHVVFIASDRNREILEWLRDDPEQRYDFLADVTAVDYGGGRPLHVVYQLWSMPHRRGLRVKCELPLSALQVDSVVPLWQAADWLEREVYDLFGIDFEGHPDLRRILMPENYAEGHPLRKDFPLRGRFSRAEQTRRALSQDPHDHYIPMEMEVGRPPQMPRDTPAERPSLPDFPEESGGGEDPETPDDTNG